MGDFMPLMITPGVTAAQITNCINSFNPGYHADYFHVRPLAQRYLAISPATDPVLINNLALSIHGVLYRWGAGRRKAPHCQPIHHIETALMNVHLHQSLAFIANHPLTTFKILSGYNRTNTLGVGPARLDLTIIDTINMISRTFFIGNMNITYPMKALLLLTGFMPALDSQVRSGLQATGFTGTTVNLNLPANPHQITGRKITRLPYYLADCYARNALLINTGVAASHFPHLLHELGRLFDVLFFMQSRLINPPPAVSILQLQPPHYHRWYDLP
jgi:hypothetical protein